MLFFFFQAEDGIRDFHVTGVQTCALPILMGSGDWNDGMNRVGRSGKGESVWLAFFLLDILRRFAAVCESRGDVERASAYRRHARSEERRVGKSVELGGRGVGREKRSDVRR